MIARADKIRRSVAMGDRRTKQKRTTVINQSTVTQGRREQIQEISRCGFLVLDKVLAATTVQQLVDSVESLEADGQATRVRRGIAFARRNILTLDFVQTLIAQPIVRELLDALAPNSLAVRAILFDKTGRANWTVPWHQDRSIAVRERVDARGFGPWSTKAGVVHVQPPFEVLKQMLTLRFHLDACDANNGPLRVIAGTHHRIFDQKEIADLTIAATQTVCTVKAGGLLVMRPLILHASSAAVNVGHRRVIHVEFGPPSLPGGLRWAFAEG